MSKLLSKEYKQKVLKEDKKAFSRCYKKTKRFRGLLFSKKRKVLYSILDFILFVLPNFIFSLATICLVIFSNNLDDLIKEIDATRIEHISGVMLTVAYFLFGTVLVTNVVSGLISDNEYFDKTELTLFLKTRFLGSQSMLLLCIYDFVYVVLLVISHCIESHLSIISTSIFVIIYSIVIFVCFIKFKTKMKIDRYISYIDSIDHIFAAKKSDIIHSFIVLRDLSAAEDRKEAIYSIFLQAALSDYGFVKNFKSMNEKLIAKANRGESIVNEQNVIEKCLLKFSNSVMSPYRLIVCFLMTTNYYSTLLKIKDSSCAKDFYISVNSIVTIIKNYCTLDYRGFWTWKFSLDTNENFVYFADLSNCLRMANDIISTQIVLSFFYTLFVQELKKIIEDIDNPEKKEWLEKELKEIEGLIDAKEKIGKENSAALTHFLDATIDIVKDYCKNLIEEIKNE